MAKRKLTDRELVKASGGNEAVRQLCQYRTASTVRNWFLVGRGMPYITRLLLEGKLK